MSIAQARVYNYASSSAKKSTLCPLVDLIELSLLWTYVRLLLVFLVVHLETVLKL